MKKIISRSTLVRAVFCAVILSSLLIGADAERMPQTDKVKINILSKHIRLLKERGGPPLRILLPVPGEIDSGGRRIRCDNLTIKYEDNTFRSETGEASLDNGVSVIYPEKEGDLFSVTVNGEKRRYPLPLYINTSGKEPELYVEESVNRYAADAAWGELGDLPEKDSEAFYALAHLIRARCALPYITGRHKGCHFCDLTCCQTYKGRSGKEFNDNVSVKTSGVSGGFFFHTSGGGRLLTEAVFNGRGRKHSPPKDLIYAENINLSSVKYTGWSASVGSVELAGILYPGKNISIQKIIFNMERETLLVETSAGRENLPPETFRIKINRVKGWNFLKSNNYVITVKDGVYTFSGSGLGHCAGLSFEGALQLAERGYSRYEILEHYYPGIVYNTVDTSAADPGLQYIVFDYESGRIIKSSSTSFQRRVIPCGSLFKLFVALYLASEKREIFYNYSFNCTEDKRDKNIPGQCWDRTGHGKMDIRSALPHSCNRYFASLYDKIDLSDFNRWLKTFTSENGIEISVPEVKDKAGFSNLLAGVNFRLTITVDGIMKLNRYICSAEKNRSSEEAGIIFDALHKTFTDGTAKTEGVPGENKKGNIIKDINRTGFWGKTGTVIAGTNSHHGYGIFTGGRSGTGIVALLRKGTGAKCAHESVKLLLLPELQ